MPRSGPPVRVLIAVAIVTACTLAFQVVLTRLLAAVLPYHFSFLAISLALLGTGGGALLLYIRPGWFERSLQRELARWAAVYGSLMIVIPFALIRLDFGRAAGLSAGFMFLLGLASLLAAAPSFAAGVVVALAIRGYTPWVGRVYAWDLGGAGVGALVVVPSLELPAAELIVGLGAMAAVAAALFAWSDRRRRALAAGLAVAGAGVFALAASTSLLYLDPRYGEPPTFDRVADEWNPLSRVQGYAGSDGPGLLFYDRVFAPVFRLGDGPLPGWEELGFGPQSIGYELTGPGRALIIGGGGGRDIYNALAANQRVDVIELNGGIRRVVDDALGDLSGSPYSRDGVQTTIGDGRSVLAARETEYDQVHIGFTDTLSPNSAQGYALTENNLYTLEAFEEYLDHLAPQGILNVSRLEKLVGDEAIRVTVLTLAALERHGVEDPERNVVVVRGLDGTLEYGTVLARLEPYTDAELETIHRLATERGEGIAFAPGGPYHGAWSDLAAASDWDTFCEDYELNVCPPTDDKPFFFSMKRLSQIGDRSSGYFYATDPFDILMLTLGILVILSIVAFVLPLVLVRGAGRPRASSLVYFAAIGVGFLLLEISLIQRFVLFLGFPTYALSVVLFALLVFTGVGAYLSSRLQLERRTLIAVLVAAVTLMGISAYGLQPLLRALIDQSFAVRVVLTIGLLAPIGIALGMPMPLGLQRLERLHPTGVPYAWGVNGVASVLASVLGVAIAINVGFAITTLAACACYATALAHAAFGRWPTPVGLTPSR